jgi:hypothetical protein
MLTGISSFSSPGSYALGTTTTINGTKETQSAAASNTSTSMYTI